MSHDTNTSYLDSNYFLHPLFLKLDFLWKAVFTTDLFSLV